MYVGRLASAPSLPRSLPVIMPMGLMSVLLFLFQAFSQRMLAGQRPSGVGRKLGQHPVLHGGQLHRVAGHVHLGELC